MNVVLYRNTVRGSVLLPTLIITLLVGISVGSLIALAKHQNTMTLRSTTWNAEIPIAEAGIEEAMSHINMRRKNMVTNGWSLSGTKYTKTATFGAGYYTTTITTSSTPYTITSLGFARIPLQTNFTFRTVVTQAKLGPPGWGFVGKNLVKMNGTSYIDSYDSSNPDYSTNGVYDPTKSRDRAGVASTSSLKPAVDIGGAKLYGNASSGPGGTANGNIGDGVWLQSNTGIQPGHFTDDFNMAIPDVQTPTFTNSGTITLNTLLGGIVYDYVLSAGDYVISSIRLNNTGGIYVSGSVRVYIQGDFALSGSAGIDVAPGAHIEIYVGGSLDLTGKSIVNSSKIPKNCAIYGLPTCTLAKIAGTAACYATVYMPNAALTIGGTGDFFGNAVGNSLTFSGTSNVHYDEALDVNTPDYRVIAWEEL